MQNLTYFISRYIIIYMKNSKQLLADLRKYRLKNRISQKKLASILNVTFCSVNRWFNGKQVPNEIQVFHIEELLKRGKK